MSGCDENDIAAAASVFEQISVPWSTFYSALDRTAEICSWWKRRAPKIHRF